MNLYDAINKLGFVLCEREQAIASQFYEAGREDAGLPSAVDVAAICAKNAKLSASVDKLARELAKAERRYAELLTLALVLGSPAIDKMLSSHQEEMGIERWHAIYGGPMAEALRNAELRDRPGNGDPQL